MKNENILNSLKDIDMYILEGVSVIGRDKAWVYSWEIANYLAETYPQLEQTSKGYSFLDRSCATRLSNLHNKGLLERDKTILHTTSYSAWSVSKKAFKLFPLLSKYDL